MSAFSLLRRSAHAVSSLSAHAFNFQNNNATIRRSGSHNGIIVQYEVRGIAGSADFPYLNDLPTLKKAVAIARHYPEIYGDGAATHIVRRFTKAGLDGSGISGYTHRWRVFPDGRLQPIQFYPRDWPTTRKSLDQYVRSLSRPSYCSEVPAAQLRDLIAVAHAIGFHNIARKLHNSFTHVIDAIDQAERDSVRRTPLMPNSIEPQKGPNSEPLVFGVPYYVLVLECVFIAVAFLATHKIMTLLFFIPLHYFARTRSFPPQSVIDDFLKRQRHSHPWDVDVILGSAIVCSAVFGSIEMYHAFTAR